MAITYYSGGRLAIQTSSWVACGGIQGGTRGEHGRNHLHRETLTFRSTLLIKCLLHAIVERTKRSAQPDRPARCNPKPPADRQRGIEHIPPYNLTSSEIISITSHSKTLLSTKPQLIPGISLSDCICCSWRASMRPAGEAAMMVDQRGDYRRWTPQKKGRLESE